MPTPAPDCLLGLFVVYAHARRGQPVYLLGEERQHGFRHFYPVALGVKTPLAFFLLFLAGLITIGWRWRELGWRWLAPAAAGLAIVATRAAESFT